MTMKDNDNLIVHRLLQPVLRRTLRSVGLAAGLAMVLLLTTVIASASQSPSNPHGASESAITPAQDASSSSNIASQADLPATCGQMNVVSSPNGGPGLSVLNGVSAISNSDAWAGGLYYNSDTRTLVAHWNGTAWTIVSSPNALAPPAMSWGVG